MNIYDIAKAAGVSIATVSRVLNGKGNVSERTKQKVETVIAELGYTPNAFARGLGLGSSRMVGVLCSNVRDPFYAEAVETIERELRPLGYEILLCCTGEDVAEKAKYMQLLLSKQVDAMILLGSLLQERTDSLHIAEAARQVPVILVNGFSDIPNTYGIAGDQEGAMYHLVWTLVGDGRRKLLYLEAPGTFSSLSKQNGFRRGCADCQLPAGSVKTLSVAKNIDAARRAAEEILGEGERFSAVVASDDLLAVGAMKALSARGMSAPEDVAVIGFNNSLYCRCGDREITSIDPMAAELSARAVRILRDLIGGKRPPARTVLTLDLVRRDTF